MEPGSGRDTRLRPTGASAKWRAKIMRTLLEELELFLEPTRPRGRDEERRVDKLLQEEHIWVPRYEPEKYTRYSLIQKRKIHSHQGAKS
jgi:hypothetical protein